AQASRGDGFLQERTGDIEPMLAGDTQRDARFLRGGDHRASSLKVGRHRLLHDDALARFRAGFHGLEAEVREWSDVHEVDLRMSADLFIGLDELGAPLFGEFAAGLGGLVRAGRELVSDIAIGFGVLAGDRPRADHPDSQSVVSIVVELTQYSDFVLFYLVF